MDYRIESAEPFTVIALSGEVDLKYSPRAREQILKYLAKDQHVLVDLSQVSYIDSSGVASLVEGLQFAKTKALRFALVGVSRAAMQVLQIARLDHVFTIFDTIADAQKS